MTHKDPFSRLKFKPLIVPKKCQTWTIEDLRIHLQYAVDVEFFTIPFYMAAWYSIVDQASEAARLVKSVVNQEMLHMQSAANIANAYGTDVQISALQYGGSVPHLDFNLDTKYHPAEIFSPYSTAIGPFDLERLNAMCLIEYPDWGAHNHSPSETEYASIGELYNAIQHGCKQLQDEIIPDNKQVNHFANFYQHTQLTVTETGEAGYKQVKNLIDLIVDQGEGKNEKQQYIPEQYQNPADDIQPTWDHYEKFKYLLNQPFPETYELQPYGERQKKLRDIQLTHYCEFLEIMDITFSTGTAPDSFPVVMYKNGAAISACWQNGVLPMFSVCE